MKILRVPWLFLFFSFLNADLCLSFGTSSGYLLQDINGHQTISEQPLAPVFKIAADSFPVGLFGDHDYTSFGITLFPEIYFSESSDSQPANAYLQYFPLNFCYYYRLQDFSIGAGLTLGLAQWRYRNSVATLSQKDGYQFFCRWHQTTNSFWELSYEKYKSMCNWDDEITTYYLNNISFMYGIYL
jgi:hypothetical protein